MEVKKLNLDQSLAFALFKVFCACYINPNLLIFCKCFVRKIIIETKSGYICPFLKKIIISLRKNSRVCKSMNLYLQWNLQLLALFFVQFCDSSMQINILKWCEQHEMHYVILIMSFNFDSYHIWPFTFAFKALTFVRLDTLIWYHYIIKKYFLLVGT